MDFFPKFFSSLVGKPKVSLLNCSQVVYAVGDIHGRLDCLNNLLEIIFADLRCISPTHDLPTHLVFLGDYIDRGHESAGVIKRLLELQLRNPFDKITFLKGNHEDLMSSFLTNPECDSWLDVGGVETLVSYKVPDLLAHMKTSNKTALQQICLKYIPLEHREFLNNTLKLSYKIDDLFLCHAGINPYTELSAQKPRTFMWGHPDFMKKGAPLNECTVIHGHCIRKLPDIGPNRLGIDTGAYHTGLLSAVRIVNNKFTFLTTKDLAV